jgi:hypothetical protein
MRLRLEDGGGVLRVLVGIGREELWGAPNLPLTVVAPSEDEDREVGGESPKDLEDCGVLEVVALARRRVLREEFLEGLAGGARAKCFCEDLRRAVTRAVVRR